MAALPPVRGICFDLWNTLALTDHSPHPMVLLARAFGLEGRPGWRRVLEEAIMRRPLLGISQALDALTRRLEAAPLAPDARREIVGAWARASNANRLHADALPVLSALRAPGPERLRLALLSNTQSFDIDFLSRSGLEDCFDAVLLSCHTGVLKPERVAFQLAAGRLRLEPAEIIMVGDNLHDDVAGAHAAGMRALLLDRRGTPGAGDEGVISSLWELRGRITSIASHA